MGLRVGGRRALQVQVGARVRPIPDPHLVGSSGQGRSVGGRVWGLQGRVGAWEVGFGVWAGQGRSVGGRVWGVGRAG